MLPPFKGRVIGREQNIVLVDFSREPDPPAPRFPGANGSRERALRPADGAAPPVSIGPRHVNRQSGQTLRAIVNPRISSRTKIATKI